jgi:hypothetical protein
MANPAYLLEALLPDPTKTAFPVPQLITGQGAAGKFTYESPTLAGSPMPGQWLLTELTRVFGWDERQGYGLSGAYLVPKGDPLVEMSFDVNIWASADAANYRQLLKTVLRKPTGLVIGASNSSAAMGISFPQVNDMGITAVVVTAVTPLMNPLVTSGGKGPWKAKVKLKEFRAPLPAIGIPKTVIPDKAPPNPSAQDNLDTENAKLATQFANNAQNLATLLQGGPTP